MPWPPAPPLNVSPSERLILQAIAAKKEIPLPVRRRARVVLLAADGVANHEIAGRVKLARARVLFWRQRFGERGVRGLWDREGTLPRERISPEAERRIVVDSLYTPRSGIWLPWDRSLRWTVKNLARRHHVSAATVQRVWKKHGIGMAGLNAVEVNRLKISPDPLFGPTVCELAGLFYETVGPAVAFRVSRRPFSELSFSDLGARRRKQLVKRLVDRFQNLDRRGFGRAEPAVDKFLLFASAVLAGADPDDEIHLLVERRDRGAHLSPEALAWLAARPCIRLHYAPYGRGGRQWAEWAGRWLAVIADWPMQSSFVDSVIQFRTLLEELPAGQYLDTLLIIAKSLQHGD